MKLQVTAFGISSGTICAATILVYSALAAYTGYGIEFETFFESIHPGYSLTVAGAIVGAIWEFAIGFALASFFALVYNALATSKK